MKGTWSNSNPFYYVGTKQEYNGGIPGPTGELNYKG